MKLVWEIAIPAELNREREIQLGNGRLWASLGPLDVPHEVIVSRQDKRVEFEFHYGSPAEEKRVTVAAGDVRVTTGRQSGRVFFVQCPADMDLDELEKPLLHMRTAASEAGPSSRPQRRSSHYALMANDVLPFVLDAIKHELILESR